MCSFSMHRIVSLRYYDTAENIPVNIYCNFTDNNGQNELLCVDFELIVYLCLDLRSVFMQLI